MIKDDESIEMQSKYLFDELNKSYNTENQLKTGNKRIMTKILGYQFEGNQVTVQFNSSVEMNFKYIEDDIEKRKTLEILTEKYSGQMSKEHMAAAIDKEIKALIMIEIEIEHLSGKEAIEFVRAKQKKVD